MGPLFSQDRLQDTVHRTTAPVSGPNLFPTVSKSTVGRRSCQPPSKRGSGGNSPGKSRVLFTDFPCSKKEWKSKADYRPVNSQSTCFHSKLQNGNSEKSQECYTSQRLGIFVGSDRCVFACPDSSTVTQISSVHSEWQGVPFQSPPVRSLNESLFVFTLLMTVIATHLRKRAIIMHPYLDDWLSRNQNRQTLLEHRHYIMYLITSLGLIINYQKSDLIPTQIFTFIGMEFLTYSNIVRVPHPRVQKLLETIMIIYQKTFISARVFLSLLGQLSAAADFVMLGRLHLRPLQMSLLSQWRPQKFSLNHQIKISANILHHLDWWKQEEIYQQGVPLRINPPSHTIFTDASLSGWGSHVEPEGLLFHGVWTETQSQLHINMLEMMAISMALKEALHTIKNSTELVSTDNTTVVAYLRKQGGTRSPDLCLEVWEILNWCFQNKIQLLVKHVPGKFNTLADRLSRVNKPISTEWCLNQEVANAVLHMTQFPNIDLFATRLNHRLPLYVSPIPDQKALSIDALSMNWNRIHTYAFPPFHLIPALINKIQVSQCKIVLIAPFWPSRSWFPELLSLLVSPPITLPVIPNLLEQLQGRFRHQNIDMLQLHVWELSSNQSEIRNFQNKLQTMSPKLVESQQAKFTMQNGKSLLIGQINGKLILSRPLLM